MPSDQEQLKLLQKQVQSLAFEQQLLQQKIQAISRELDKYVGHENAAETVISPASGIQAEPEKVMPAPPRTPPSVPAQPSTSLSRRLQQTFFPAGQSMPDFEKFIGENIISKIGIIILIIGVGIGTKYAIDNNLLSPFTRILLGYLLGACLLILALTLRKKYLNFSAVLLSGAMAACYLVTFAAYSFYALIPQAAAFGLMVIFTVFTVAASLSYNHQWISLLGLVGAYAVPFLLSENSGRVHILFTYMALLNTGILAVAVKRYWRILYYSAFGITWFIFLWWFVMDYTDTRFGMVMLFASVFFCLFYAVFLVHKLIEKRAFEVADVFTLLLNAFIYFGISYAAFNDGSGYEKYTGLFTLVNAALHACVAYAVYRPPSYDRNLLYLISGLALVFITVAIPVQLNGNWVTLFWASEAALLYYIGRTRKAGFYEGLSYPLMALALISQIQDWNGLDIPWHVSGTGANIIPFLNKAFALTLPVIAAFGFISMLSSKHPPVIMNPRIPQPQPYAHFFGTILPPSAVVFLLYFTFRQEMIHYWQLQYGQHMRMDGNIADNYSFPSYEQGFTLLRTWMLNYTLCFISILGYINLRYVKNALMNYGFWGLSLLTWLVFITTGIMALGEMRDAVLEPSNQQVIISRFTAFSIRYITFACAALVFGVMFLYRKKVYADATKAVIIYDLLLHITILVAGSSEIITWLKYNEINHFDKLGLTIFWGIYALIMIGLGFLWQRQHLRIGAIVLYSITLLKLFFYDLAGMNTMTKTIVFISLGFLLLTISFLYVKNKNRMDERKDKMADAG